MRPYYQQDKWAIYYGDCREILPSLEKASAIVTDPPYELGFMGKAWDSKGISFQKETWEVVRTACLSGAMLLSFGGTRTFHRIACAIEDAGWEIRDTVMWVYGSGFPKSLDISKAIDKQLGRNREDEVRFANHIKEIREKAGKTVEQWNQEFGYVAGCKWWETLRENGYRPPNRNDYEILKSKYGASSEFQPIVDRWHPIGEKIGEDIRGNAGFSNEQVPRPWKQRIGEPYDLTAPATPEAQLWNGYGTALKPAYEPIILAMNPLDGTFANNALKHGVAGLNIDECRIGTEELSYTSTFKRMIDNNIEQGYRPETMRGSGGEIGKTVIGRFPANFIHDGSQMVMELFPNPHGAGYKRDNPSGVDNNYMGRGANSGVRIGDNGSAARFFYVAKASKAERDRGLEDMEGELGHNRFDKCATCGGYLLQNPDRPSACKCENPVREHNTVRGNTHPTVKPLALVTYLVKLVKMPEYNLVIDPFMGSGTTLLACIRLGIPCIGIDNDEKSCEIAVKRCSQEVMELAIP